MRHSPSSARRAPHLPATPGHALPAARAFASETAESESAPASSRTSSHDFARIPLFPPAPAGRPLPPPVRGRLEGALGHDFSAVRVHESAGAAAIGARAFTRGSHVHFAPGEYRPDSPGGRALLGHELAHVVQQGEGRVRATGRAGALPVNGDAAFEREADRLGARAAHAAPALHAAPAAAAPAPPLPVPHAAPAQMKWWKKGLAAMGVLGGGAMLAAGLATASTGLAVAGGVTLAATGLGYAANRWANRGQAAQDRPQPEELRQVLVDREPEPRPPTHADHQRRFHELLGQGRRNEALQHVARSYGMAPDDANMPYTLEEERHRRAHRHATTYGGYRESGRRSRGPRIAFNTPYLDRGGPADDRQFANLVHTLRHEHTHVRQRADRDTMMTTNEDIREFDAYSTETLHDQDLPPLDPADRRRKATKARGHFEAARTTPAFANLPQPVRDEYIRRNAALDPHL